MSQRCKDRLYSDLQRSVNASQGQSDSHAAVCQLIFSLLLVTETLSLGGFWQKRVSCSLLQTDRRRFWLIRSVQVSSWPRAAPINTHTHTHAAAIITAWTVTAAPLWVLMLICFMTDRLTTPSVETGEQDVTILHDTCVTELKAFENCYISFKLLCWDFVNFTSKTCFYLHECFLLKRPCCLLCPSCLPLTVPSCITEEKLCVYYLPWKLKHLVHVAAMLPILFLLFTTVSCMLFWRWINVTHDVWLE